MSIELGVRLGCTIREEGILEYAYTIDAFKTNHTLRGDGKYISLEDALKLFYLRVVSETDYQLVVYLAGEPVGFIFLAYIDNEHYGRVLVETHRWIKYPVIGTGSSHGYNKQLVKLYKDFLKSMGVPYYLRTTSNGTSHTHKLKHV